MPVTKNPSKTLAELAVTFVDKQKGEWNHEQWEQLVARASAMGIDMDDEGKRNLGNVLEGLKFFYRLTPKSAGAKPAPKKKAMGRR